VPEEVELDACVVKGEEPVQKVTPLPGGAKRDGYFKRRDYS